VGVVPLCRTGSRNITECDCCCSSEAISSRVGMLFWVMERAAPWWVTLFFTLNLRIEEPYWLRLRMRSSY